MNKGMLIGIVVIGVVVVGGLGMWYINSNSKSQTLPAGRQVPSPKMETTVEVTPSPTEEVLTGEVKEITVEGSNLKFSPAIITVKKGDVVSLTFKSGGDLHDFVIDEFDVKTNQIGEGEEETVEFVADKTGIFEYYCSVGKHRQMGMVGKLIVE